MRSKMIQKAYRYRLYPDEKQKIYFAKSFGCVRFIWNWMLDETVKEIKAMNEFSVACDRDMLAYNEMMDRV